MPTNPPFIALTDHRWFEYLRSRSQGGRLDEANFWLPKAQRPPAHLEAGDAFFLRLKSPTRKIAGFGFYGSFCTLPLHDAWTTFGDRNGDATWEGFHDRIIEYRLGAMDATEMESRQLGCIALVHLTLWPEQLWIPWGEERGWKPQTEAGKYERDPTNVEILMSALSADAPELPAELTDRFNIVDCDERLVVQARTIRREGQGAFRTRLLRAYDGACAITGEHTEPVLAAAHIQSYLGPRSNHVQNGLLLTEEFHILFDRGYVAVTPDYRVQVSSRLQQDFGNGRRYRQVNGQLLELPKNPRFHPSRDALQWHCERVFKAG